MLLLLPPSETKRDGGEDGTCLDLAGLKFPGLTSARRRVVAATRALSSNIGSMSVALKLGPSQRFEVLRNRELRRSPTCAAMDRYTGVLYDALDASTLDAAAREFAARHVVIHSAMFGLIGAADRIPAYRLSQDSRLPGLPLASVWRRPLAELLGGYDGLIIDLRSNGYVDLGPIPVGRNAFFVRVAEAGPDGRIRALNHFNKKAKGEFVRAVTRAGIDHDSVDSLVSWATGAGISLSRSAGELELLTG